MTTLQQAQANIRRWRQHPETFVREQFGVEPDAWQRETLQAFADPTKQRISLQACAGPGKAHNAGMLLDTPTGVRKWGDLVAGEEVFAPDGTATRIVATHRRGILPMFTVTFDDGSSTRCCADHLWTVRGRAERRHNSWVVLSTAQINERNQSNDGQRRRQFEIPRHAAVRFPRDERYRRIWRGVDLHPYVLGVWLGDGGKGTGRGSWRDAAIDAEVAALGYTLRRCPNGTAVTVYGILDELRRLGVADLGSHERMIPASYKTLSVKHRKALLSGLMDTDGCIGTDGSMEFDTTSRQLADDVVWLTRSLGGVAFVKATIKKPWYYDTGRQRRSGRDCFRVSVTLPFNPFHVPKKVERWHRPQSRYLTRYVDRIEPSEPDEAMCIEVAHHSACYLANDFIVTHNTAVLAWCGWNFLTCYAEKGEHPKGAAVSITGENLDTNLWPELAKWQGRSAFLSAAFTWTKTRIVANDHPETWFLSARSYPKSATAEEQGKTLSGLHSRYVLSLIDESGAIPTTVLRAAEQALSNCAFGKIVQAGNPISLEGMLYAAATTLAAQWHIIKITGDPDDPNRSPRIDKAWAQRQIETYGRDNPWVMSYILGKFPPSSLNSLLGPEDVQAAMIRELPADAYNWAQTRLGVDVARYGDDRTVIFPRQGKRAFLPKIMRHIRDSAVSTDIATAVLAERERYGGRAPAVMDATGGWAAGASDVLRASDHSNQPINVQFHAAGLDQRYKNRRAEMWFQMAEWVKSGGWLPNIPELVAELSQPTYTFVNGKFQLEPKEQVKERLGRSPDLADALALTFGIPEVAPKRKPTISVPVSSGSGGWMGY